MASRAFTARFRIALSTWFWSTSTGHSRGDSALSSSTCSPKVRCSSSAMLRTSAFRSVGVGSSACLRENASSREVRLAARSAACLDISSARRMRAVSLGLLRAMVSSPPMMTVRRLLKSWATPPVSCPTASIFWDWNSASRASSSSRCEFLRSVMSWVILAKPISSPASSRMASMITWAQKRVPSLRTRQPSVSQRPSVAACRNPLSGTPASRSSSV